MSSPETVCLWASSLSLQCACCKLHPSRTGLWIRFCYQSFSLELWTPRVSSSHLDILGSFSIKVLRSSSGPPSLLFLQNWRTHSFSCHFSFRLALVFGQAFGSTSKILQSNMESIRLEDRRRRLSLKHSNDLSQLLCSLNQKLTLGRNRFCASGSYYFPAINQSLTGNW